MRLLFTLLTLLTCSSVFAQSIPPSARPLLIGKTTHRDTVIEKDTSKENKEPQYFYLSLNNNVSVNTKGGAAKRFSPAVEVGRTYGIFDIGLAFGRVNSLSSGSDTSHYIEFRPTINVFSKGRFAEAFCLGGGYVFKAKQGLMTEICNSINFNINEIWQVSVTQGYVFFDGTNDSRTSQFMGFALTYNFLRKHSVNIQRKKKAIISDN